MENTPINDNLVEELTKATISDNRHPYQETATLDTQPPWKVSSASTLERKNGLGQVLCHGRSMTKGGELCNRHGSYSYKNDSGTEPQVFCYDHHPDHHDRRCHAIVSTSSIVKKARQCLRITTGGCDAESGRPLCNTHLLHKPARLISLMHEETSHPKGGISFQPIDTSLKRYSIPDVKLPSLSQQEFRLPYNKVQTIPASYDYSQHCSVIYWDEVHDICRDAQYLLDGETIVPFMTDDNFDYVMPLRVAYRPGTVFEVVTGTHIAVDEVATTMDNVLDPSGKRHSNFDFSADNSKDDSDEEYEEYSDTPSPMSDTPCSTNPVSLAMGKWRRRVAHYSNNATFTKSYYCHCPSCDRRFVSSDALMGIHVESVPPSIHNDCCVDSCDKRFADGKTFDRHQDTDHSYNEHQSFDKAVEKHSVPEKPSISALSLLPKPTLFTRYSLETRINSVVFREYRLHELSSPRLFILLPEKINNGDSGYGGIDGQPESPGAGLGIGPESMMGNGHGHGKGDQGSMVYSSSAPSPSTRPKRRSEVFADQESPYFYPAQQHFNLFSADQSMSYNLKIAAKIDRGFFLAANDWTCYRRNYFQLSASFSILGLNTSIHPEVPCLLERSGELLSVRAFLICIGARMQNGEKVIELVQHTPKRDKGPQITPQPTHVRAGGDLSINSSGSNPNVITFERVQFKTATANNGKRRAAQQYYQVHVDLFAELDNGELILVADAFSAPLVVRGRSPGHYADTDDVPVDSSAPHGAEARYHYRNDSISSGGGGPLGSPISPSEYPYYGYTYGSSYPYQSLGSASHVATHTHDAAYYDRKNSDSYPASPLSPSTVPHPGESVSPDMYSPAGFAGPDSPSTFNRLPQMAGHPQSHYNSTYAQYYAAQQHHEMYRDQDHETQMAGLRIHSPTSPKPPNSSATASPIPTPRRQSFSSTLISKKTERVVGGSTTRKSRSISLSGTMSTTTVSKHASSKARSVRTVPATPTSDMSRGHQGYSDRIPEEDQHLM